MKHNALIAMVVFVALMLSGCGRQEPLAPDLTEVERLQKLGLGNDPDPITVMTRNVYVGASIDAADLGGTIPLPLLVQAAANDILVAKPFPLRAALLANEIAATNPDLIGLQEVEFVQIPAAVPGGLVEVDYLEILLDALELLGLDYKVAGIVENIKLEFPLPGFEGFKLIDRDVVLVRSDVKILEEPEEIRYNTTFVFPLVVPDPLNPENTITIPIPFFRGFVAVKVKVRGRPYRFVNTHLENENAAIRLLQAQELANFLHSQGLPIILVGDFNTVAPTGLTYQGLVGEGFVDVWTKNELMNNPEGFTSSLPKNLIDDVDPNQLKNRIDLIFVRNRPLLNVEASLVGLPLILSPFPPPLPPLRYPSDHAGVVADLVIGIQKHRGAMAALGHPSRYASSAPDTSNTGQIARALEVVTVILGNIAPALRQKKIIVNSDYTISMIERVAEELGWNEKRTRYRFDENGRDVWVWNDDHKL